MADPSPNIGVYDALDEYLDNSDGAHSWHSEEMKTPPNSKDEFGEVENDEAFLVFREGTRFEKLLLEVGMKFNTKLNFKEAVREYCIQEGRRVWFKKNDNVRMYIMSTIARNKLKFMNHVGLLPPVQRSRLEKIRNESKNWVPMWSGDADYEQFEVHGWPTNMAVDLEKRLCTCGFWQLNGTNFYCDYCSYSNYDYCYTLVVVVVLILILAGKQPENFCHKWLTMGAYNDTYAFHINPIPGQKLWEKSIYNRPQAPKFKKMLMKAHLKARSRKSPR
ncbi:hypothetical protein Ahy_A03g015448 isoform B [Arachis hypogaea]|uniref:Transposase MuDR plant domain-containing protein n=1 Tax=Arachis hypogaea TaxID=3818 RepID=A0A445E0U6_ARAHY|nr:hypothetical protein Ahy_A03g015448 isoform B [Arachis hypogaea]